ncbi:Chorismate synthase chloroplastic [Artemisia annua]|uniref:chorismate synthase n=1 Tax=Artemisia annua TaxID=35608 RepID=A0A2U1MPX7_ARTAN|nr:Chorismate synthase chloroplastic [Artemisia annua]
MEFCQIYVVTSKLQLLESNICRCPDPEYARNMIVAIDAFRVRGDSIGGVVTCIVRNPPEDLVHQFLTNLKLNWLRQLYQYLQPRALSLAVDLQDKQDYNYNTVSLAPIKVSYVIIAVMTPSRLGSDAVSIITLQLRFRIMVPNMKPYQNALTLDRNFAHLCIASNGRNCCNMEFRSFWKN